jgi:serine/threonine protein kinase
MLTEQVIDYLESLFGEKRESLDATQKLIIQYSWEGKKYEEMAEYISGYSLGYLKTNIGPEFWSKLTRILRLSGLISDDEQLTKKNMRIILEPIVKRYHPDDLVGKIIHNRFQIQQFLSQGEFGNSYIGQDLQVNNKLCVIKQFKVKSAPDIKMKFERESGALYRLSWHSQIPRLVAHFEDELGYFLVYEFVEGVSLNHRLSEEILSKPWGENETLKLIEDILTILEFVHQNNIIHRDIKPSNLIKKPDGTIILINFGSIKQLDNTNKLTFFGTKGYMAPEQGGGMPRQSSDLYSVAKIGIQALTGLPPTQFRADYETGQLIWRDLVTVSETFADILDKMAHVDFKIRYQSAQEVLKLLRLIKPLNQ